MMLQKLNAIDFGNYNIKVARGKMRLRKVVVDEASRIRTPEGLVDDGLLTNPAKLVGEMGASLELLRRHSKETIITASSSQIIVSDLVVPKLSGREMQKVLEAEMEEKLHIKPEEYAVNFKTIEAVADEERNGMRLLAVAVPKRIIESYLTFLEHAKLESYAIDFIGNSLVKQVIAEVETREARRQNVVIMDIGYRNTKVSVMINGQLRYFRTFYNACEAMFRAVCERMHCSWDEARDLTRKYGVMPCNEEGYSGQYVEVSHAVKAVLSWICGDIKAYLGEIDIAADKVILVGGGALLKNIEEHMRKEFNTHVFRHTRFGEVRASEDAEAELGAYFAGAFGALKR